MKTNCTVHSIFLAVEVTKVQKFLMLAVTNSQVEGCQRPGLVVLFISSGVEASWTLLEIQFVLVAVQVSNGCGAALGVIGACLAFGCPAHHPLSTCMS